MRVGQGVDAHRFAAGRPLVLGGVRVPFELGLEAHSDGDVVMHAVTDALLGAVGAGDLGRHFPDTDPAYAGVDSRRLLREAVALARGRGWTPVNVDATVIAQRPRLAGYLPAMQQCFAEDLGLPEDAVNLKATTTERMGFTGRGEGIAAMAVVLVTRVATP